MAERQRVLHGATSGRDVRRVQEALAGLGYALGAIDGVYGRRTEQAVRQFQRRAGLDPDGVFGPLTFAALAKEDPALRKPPPRLPLHSSTTGDDVQAVQARLRDLGLPVDVDGVFGPSTERAVLAFQRQAGLRADGIVGPATHAALIERRPPRPKQSMTLLAERLLLTAALVHGTRTPWAADVVAASTLLKPPRDAGPDVPVVARVAAAAQPMFGDLAAGRDAAQGDVAVAPWLVDEAVSIRDRVEGPAGPIDARHVLAAAIAGPGARFVEAVLRRHGKPADLLRLALRDAIAETRPADVAAWSLVLGVPVPEEHDGDRAGGFSSDYVPVTPAGEPLVDRLGVDVYVRMLALLVADTRTPMPLSIGLFGEWGAGKSYFMGLLRRAIADLTTGADGAGAATYHQDVVQITFNAWHYSDANLWASLADEIFEQLAGPSANPGDDEQRREEIRSDLTKTMRRRKELTQRTESAAREVAELRRQVQVAEAERDESRKELLGRVLRDDAVRVPLDKAARALGLGGAERERFRELAAEAGGARADARTAWRYFAGRAWSVWSALLVAAFVALLTAAPFVAGELRTWFGTSAAASVAAAAMTATTGLAKARGGLAKLREAADAADALAVRSPSDEEKALREAEAHLETLTVQLDEVVTRAGELGRELAELSAGHRLYRFIAERAASDDYRRHLGIVSSIRRDFERLVELMAEWRAKRDDPDAEGERPPRPIDRIVLYIDDLDRCSAEQVVDVLQAVHLLLAMDLFVVVVGVDPRWLLRALRRQYAGILEADGDTDAWASTPRDYMEKIFNIPFALPGMTPEAYTGLLAGIAGEVETRAAVTTEAADDAPPPSAASEEPLVAEERSEIAVSFEPGGAPATVRPMTGAELAYLARLAPLMRTPRSATRMLNIYRMLRSTKDLSAGGVFLRNDGGGEYRVVAQLLAVLTAYPRVLGPLLFAPPGEGVDGGVVHRSPGTSWSDFVAGLPVKDGRNAVVAGIEPVDAPAWDQVARCLSEWADGLGAVDVEPFQRWAPHVTRFSFQPGPVAAPA